MGGKLKNVMLDIGDADKKFTAHCIVCISVREAKGVYALH
jgi:hypothetical protein